ncbi:hypothetical protein [Actinocatenispora comari]|uniref:Uncharacterized protein n=1 Tax=Actinocatenispora comari TaxID=2807577 RepID=A0A8J4ENY0_9ACTN|nr:hypothetical protein [Actinocatenispora comari]GIL30745.1 hypothetical protein NUM_59990 [Actinocatenispora comari]
MATLAAAAALGTTAAALPAVAGPTARPALTIDRTGAGHARTTRVTLPTGDRVVVGTDARGRVRTAHPAGTAHRTYLTQRYGADTYVVPATALHELGTGSYRLAQFDVSALVAGRPGVTPGSGVAHPDFPMRTATIKVTDPQGKPVDDASLSVINVDDSRKYVAFPEAVNGEARISVPDGHYALMAYYYTADDQGELTGEWMSFGQFTVAGKATSTAVDLRRATHEVSVTTPKPAEAQSVDFTWARGSSEDYSLESGVSTYAGHPIRLSTSPAGVGIQHFYVHETSTSPASAAKPYLYDVIFPSDRAIGANQHYQATAGSLATLNTSYYADKPRTGDSVWFDSPSWELFQFRTGIPLPQPMRRTEYLTGGSDLTYSAIMDASMSDESFGGTFQSGSYVFRGGQHERVDWLRGPLAPTIPADTGVGPYFCGACRIDDTLSIALAPVGDSTPDHAGYLDDPSQPGTVSTSRFQLFSGGTRLVDQKDVTGADIAVPAARKNYRISYDQTRKAPWTGQSTASHSEWTFSSAHSGTTTVPTDRWGCGADGDTTHCSPVSLLLPHYQLTQGLDGRIPLGRNTLTLTVDHSAGAPRVPVESATVSVSFDDGKTWTTAKVNDLGAGTFRAHWNNPATTAGHPMTLKVTASDSTHATVTQIVHAAATVAQS